MSEEMIFDVIVNTKDANGQIKSLEQQIREMKTAVSKASQDSNVKINIDGAVKSINEVVKAVDVLQNKLEEVNRQYLKSQNNSANKQALAEIKELNKENEKYLQYLKQEASEVNRLNKRDDKIDNQSYAYERSIPNYVSYNQQLHSLNEQAQKLHQEWKTGVIPTANEYYGKLGKIKAEAKNINKAMADMPMLLGKSNSVLGSFEQKFR